MRQLNCKDIGKVLSGATQEIHESKHVQDAGVNSIGVRQGRTSKSKRQKKKGDEEKSGNPPHRGKVPSAISDAMEARPLPQPVRYPAGLNLETP